MVLLPFVQVLLLDLRTIFLAVALVTHLVVGILREEYLMRALVMQSNDAGAYDRALLVRAYWQIAILAPSRRPLVALLLLVDILFICTIIFRFFLDW